MSFWSEIKKPIFAMAPMEDVTDVAFRQMFARHSNKTFVAWTEFVSADGLALAPEEGRAQLLSKLQYGENERPIVAQLFGANPEHMHGAAQLVADLGFDGIDINMGCPDKSVEKGGAGAALIKNPDLAREIIRAAKAGAGELPVSVKTRLGYNDLPTGQAGVSLEWLASVLEEHPAALTVHLRTRKEMSDYPAHWELMPQILELRDKLSPETLIIGNGDVASMREAGERVDQYGCDGVMIGRGLFGNPAFFNNEVEPRCLDKLHMLIEHLELFDAYLLSKGYKGYHVMKKHFKAYIAGFKGAKELRMELMETNTPHEARKILQDYLL